MKTVHHGLLMIASLLLLGCGRSTPPVQELRIEESQVVIRDVPILTDQWAVWRGPAGNGVSDAASVPSTWTEATNIKWTTNIAGRGHGSPCVVGKKVLLATADDQEQLQSVVALDAESGDMLWTKEVHRGGFPSKGEVHQKGSNANSTLASDGKHAFIAFFNSNKIIATALTLDGEVAWQKELGGFRSRFGFAPSPILYRSLVIFACDHFGGGYLVALDGESGEVAWRKARPAKNSHSTPLIADCGGRNQLLISGCGTVDSYDPETGERLWSTKATSDTTCGTMVADSTHVFASGGFPDRQTVCLDSEGKQVWENNKKIYEPSMLLYDEVLYAASDDGILYAWETTTGKELWKKRLGGNISASPIVCNGLIYVSNLSGDTFVFQPSKEKYIAVAKNRLGNDHYASPAAVDGRLFMRVGFTSEGDRQEKVVCIEDSVANE